VIEEDNLYIKTLGKILHTVINNIGIKTTEAIKKIKRPMSKGSGVDI
jgi:hypothetical protein